MISLKERSYKREILDLDNIPFEDIKQNMKELNTVNSLLGGHKITIAGIKALIPSIENKASLIICEIGCGGGDNLKAINSWGIKQNINLSLIGIDIKPACVEYAAGRYPELKAKWLTSDYAQVDFENSKPDIIFSSLFCHHFNEAQLVSMLTWMKNNSRLGFFINDLERNLLAYYSIKWITRAFSKSYLVKNDAPLSVARGFKKREWENIVHIAGIEHYSIEWKWAFRYLIVCRNES